MNNKLYISIATACTLAANSLVASNNNDLGVISVSSATKSEQSIKDVTSNVTVITKYDLEDRNITTVKDALNLISGINFTSNGGIGSTSSILLRGMGNSRTLILIDGIKLQDPSSTSGTNIAHLMVNDIEKIEVIKGAQSGVWGADATAGIVNIITKKPKQGTDGFIEFEYGSFKSQKITGSISHKQEKFAVKLSAQDIDVDGFSVQAPKGESLSKYEDDSYENTNFQFNGEYYINGLSSIGINYIKTDAKKEYDSWNNPNDNTMRSDIDNDLYSIQYNHTIDNHNIKLKYEKSKFAREENGATFGVKEFEGEIDNIEINDNFEYLENSFLLLGAGASKDEVTFTPVFGAITNRDNKDKYLYLTNSNRFNNLIVTESLRYDKYNNFNNKLTGKLGIKYNATQDLYFSANYGTAYNVPNIVQELNPWGGINNDLNPENSYSTDFNIGYKDFKFTYFYQRVSDLINWYDPDGFGGVPGIFKNLTGDSTFKGFELEYKKEVVADTLFSLNYTRVSAKNKDGEFLNRRPNQTLKFGIDNYSFAKLHIGLYGEYIGARYENTNKQGAQTGKYTVANFVADYNLSSDIKVYGKIENLTDKYYQTADGFATSPRAFYAGIKYSF